MHPKVFGSDFKPRERKQQTQSGQMGASCEVGDGMGGLTPSLQGIMAHVTPKGCLGLHRSTCSIRSPAGSELSQVWPSPAT